MFGLELHPDNPHPEASQGGVREAAVGTERPRNVTPIDVG